MAKNFLAGPNLKAQGQRNGFDVSYQNQFHVPFGMLLPCFFQRVNPDDKLKLSLESQTICDGLVKPAFMRLKEHIDYYFVPTQQLYMPFDNIVTGQNSYFSTAVSQINDNAVASDIPVFQNLVLGELLKQNESVGQLDEQGFDFNSGAVRLLDMLGYGNLTPFLSHFTDQGSTFIYDNDTTYRNFFPLLAYQKVYYDFYRNEKYENNDPSAYNLDDLESGTQIGQLAEIGVQRFNKFLSVHYRWQKRDYFTQTQPNVLAYNQDYGYQGLDQIIEVSNLLNVPGLPSTTETRSGQSQSTGVNKGLGVLGAQGNSNQTLNVASIRFAFAYDRLLRRMRQAGPNFDAQMLAQFGVKPVDARHGKCTYIGGYTNNLSSKDVTNMTGEGIGDLAGQINSYNDNTKRTLRYHAKEHGYVIGIYSTSVDNMYQSFRVSREVLLRNRYDWFNPAFENLGLQPVFEGEYDYTDKIQALTPKGRGYTYDKTALTTILGYIPRYSELKSHPDECHGLLCQYCDQTGMKEWNVQVNRKANLDIVLNKRNMQLSPNQFDAVSGIIYNGFPETDHFVVNMYHHSHKVSSMTLYEEF